MKHLLFLSKSKMANTIDKHILFLLLTWKNLSQTFRMHRKSKITITYFKRHAFRSQYWPGDFFSLLVSFPNAFFGGDEGVTLGVGVPEGVSFGVRLILGGRPLFFGGAP